MMKAIALGANGVGIGRPFLYAYSAYGQEGVEQAFRILHVSLSRRYSHESRLLSVINQDEFEMNMRLIGARSIKELVPEMVDARNLHQHTVSVPSDRLFDTNCECQPKK